MHIRRTSLLLLFAVLALGTLVCASEHKHAPWVASWAASPTLLPLRDPISDSTIRNVIHLSLGGSAVRVILTNQFGTAPLRIGSAQIALSAGGGRLQVGSDHQLTFDHQTSVSIPAGSYVLSDPIEMHVEPFADLAISFYLPKQTIAAPTCHQWALSTNFIAAGDEMSETELRSPRTITSWCFLQSVIVQAQDKHAAAVVAFGDSITDGAHSTLNANRRYPDDLAIRLQTSHKTAHLAVINEGIAGGRVLFEGHGPSALARFDRDVLAQPGIRYVIYLEGINDIGQILKPHSPENSLTVDDLIFAAIQLVTRAHQHGVRVFGATLLPFGPKELPANSDWLKVRKMIDEYNQWVRTSQVFDGVIDFNKATADPGSPDSLLPSYDSGDHGHPNDAGYKAMANAIDLSMFR